MTFHKAPYVMVWCISWYLETQSVSGYIGTGCWEQKRPPMSSLDYSFPSWKHSNPLTAWGIKMLAEWRKQVWHPFMQRLPVIDCRDVVLTWHPLCRAAFSQSVQLPAYIRLFVRLPGWLSRLPCCVCFLVSVSSPEVRSHSGAEDHTRQAHLESPSWLHLPVSKPGANEKQESAYRSLCLVSISYANHFFFQSVYWDFTNWLYHNISQACTFVQTIIQ